jgi:TonB family protein
MRDDHILKRKLAIVSLLGPFIIMLLPVCSAQGQRGVYSLVGEMTLREQPEEKSRKTAKLNPGKKPLLIEGARHDDWIQLTNADGVTGWTKISEKGLIAVPDMTDAEGNAPALQNFNGITSPKAISQPLPKPVRIEPRQRIKALIALVIEKDGSIGKKALLVSSGIIQFDASSLQAIESWRFEPPEISGHATSMLAIAETTLWNP